MTAGAAKTFVLLTDIHSDRVGHLHLLFDNRKELTLTKDAKITETETDQSTPASDLDAAQLSFLLGVLVAL